MDDDVARRIHEVRFRTVRLREGYDLHEVDTFLDRLVEAAGRGEDLAEPIRAARFTPVRLRDGYDMPQVDAFLAELAGGRSSGDPAADTPGRPRADQDRPAVVDPGVIVENRGLLSRLFGRR